MNQRSVLLVALFLPCALIPTRADALRLVTYAYQGETRIGAVADDQVIDLNRAYEGLLREQGDPRPEAMAEAIVPPEMLGFLEGQERSMAAAHEAVAFAQKQPADEAREQGMVRDVSAVHLKAPIPRPTKITLMGFNYRAHAEEMLEDVPEHPLLFAAYPSVVNGPNSPIVIPEGSETPDYEAEFGVVIGKAGRNVSPDEAMEHVAGYVIVNDGTDRAWQSRGSQYLIGKSVETFKVIGPYLVTKDEIADPHDLDIKLWVNDELRQDSNTSLQVFKIPDVVAYMSTFWELEPGDVLSTGTPPGVGHGREPPVYLEPGDEIRIEISGLGTLENPVVAAE
jgi:acylpyruvate hydrolase